MTEGPPGEPPRDPIAELPGEPPRDPPDLGDATAGGAVDPVDLGDPAAPGASSADRPIDYEPPWREARVRMTRAWDRGGAGTRVALALAVALAVALLGAFLFGLWHLVVGGFLKGNWNAGGFGIALASVAGVLLWIEAAIARRLLSRPASP
jgi:hypothetical protein